MFKFIKKNLIAISSFLLIFASIVFLTSIASVSAESSSISVANLFRISGSQIVPNFSNWTLNFPLSSPTNITLASTSGSLGKNQPLFFNITATNGTGTTTASNEVSTTTNLSGTQGLILNWSPVPNATAYFINFGTTTPGSENAYYIATTSGQYTFTSTSTPTGYGKTPSFPTSFALQIGNSTSTVISNNTNIGPFATTTPALGGSALTVGQCSSVSSFFFNAVLSSTTVIMTTPQKYPGDGTWWESYVATPTTIVTKVCVTGSITPVSTIYNLRAF